MLKAVIPVAGLGTRMLPATKAIPKEMLPIVDRPLIQYIVEECAAAGIREIILVTHASKNAIENHFDTSFELESLLESRLKRQLLDEVRSICPDDVRIMHIRQGQALGLGHAVRCAYPLVGDNPFAVILPDVLINPYCCRPAQDNLSAMLRRFAETGVSQIMVEPVADEDLSRYGVADCGGRTCVAGASAPMHRVVEKPQPQSAPSNLAVVGRYVFSAAIWPALQQIRPGVGNEIQLTDAVDLLLTQEPVEAYALVGKSHDCGDKIGYIEAFVEYALQHASLAEPLRAWLSRRFAMTEA
ncbi:UTP--glucose-1-phosphate uridylyltransferase GalU [Martelella alba]|uniref:UTP--glucose-1-phosphate uridylyltransferase n=1 Tax=Martelella alba TaxID=2590451 RepID=A0ABY2SHK2_9HYPH|nr:UTP--glucose-1-phosphate uridylyltransferase GalU [Martelella alba]TKI04582.1 UTP--glucose-1-phosphate uridylyltransferase GalU [Martelella alba]